MVIIGPLVGADEDSREKVENVVMKINHTQLNAGILYVRES